MMIYENRTFFLFLFLSLFLNSSCLSIDRYHITWFFTHIELEKIYILIPLNGQTHWNWQIVSVWFSILWDQVLKGQPYYTLHISNIEIRIVHENNSQINNLIKSNKTFSGKQLFNFHVLLHPYHCAKLQKDL